MDKSIITRELQILLEAINEQFEIIREYQDFIPQIEFDMIMENVRKLYETFHRLQRLNDPLLFIEKKISGPGDIKNTKPRIVNREPEIVSREPEILNLEPEILNLEPETLNREPEMVNLEPEILNLEPETLNLEPEMVNLEPETLNREPEMVNLEPETLNREPEMVNLEPEMVNLEPETLNREPEMVNLEPEMVNLEPETLNLEPETLNLEPLTERAAAEESAPELFTLPLPEVHPQSTTETPEIPAYPPEFSDPAVRPPIIMKPVVKRATPSKRHEKSSDPDLFASEEPVFNIRLKEAREKSLGPKGSYQESFKAAIGINDKFMFINELFDGNLREYNEGIETLSGFKNLPLAQEYLDQLRHRYNWDSASNALQRIKELVEKRF